MENFLWQESAERKHLCRNISILETVFYQIRTAHFMKNAHKGFLAVTFISYVLLYTLIAFLS